MNFLYQELNVLKKYNTLSAIPDELINSLSSKIVLRDYQIEAIKYFITYVEGPLSKNKQIWSLFHMATGSGKTVIIAFLILYFYKIGYRNFVFFVKNVNILEKTISNLTDNLSNKYLFSNPIVIDSKVVEIKKVRTFLNSSSDSINICFTTNAGLSNSMQLIPNENSLTRNDFEDNKIILIADESHHLNASTKNGKYIFEDKEDSSWETTVMDAFHANKDNVLLEFTATCDIENPYVIDKYKNVIVYNYPLYKFREDKYSKEISSLPSSNDHIIRTFIALIISQYRYKLFIDAGFNYKPVIMLKSKNINASEEFYNHFYKFLTGKL